MQVVPQGHDFHRAQAAPVPVPSAPSVATAAAGADFSRPNVIFDGNIPSIPFSRFNLFPVFFFFVPFHLFRSSFFGVESSKMHARVLEKEVSPISICFRI
jgi:hypothetical protein